MCSHSVSVQGRGVALVGCRWLEWECAALAGRWVTLTKAASSSHAAGPAWGLFLFSPLTRCAALARSGWDEVTSSVPCQNGSDEHLPPQHTRSQLPERLVALAVPGVLSSSEEELCLVQNYFFHQILIEVICWSTPAANLSLGLLFCSCLNHTLMNDQCEMSYEEKKKIISQLNVQYSVYFKSAVYKKVNLFPIPWQDLSFFLSRYGVWLNVGRGWVSRPGYCIYLCGN